MLSVFIILIVLACLLLLLIASCKRAVGKTIANHNCSVNRKTVVSVDITAKNDTDDFVIENFSSGKLTDAVWADDEPRAFDLCGSEDGNKAALEKIVELITESSSSKKVFQIVSPKAFVFVNIAILLTKANRKCLLVELDKEEKLLTKIFNIKTGRFAIKRGFYPTPIKKLFLAPHFSIPAVLRSLAMLKDNFDVILVCQPQKSKEFANNKLLENIDTKIICNSI